MIYQKVSRKGGDKSHSWNNPLYDKKRKVMACHVSLEKSTKLLVDVYGKIKRFITIMTKEEGR
jgi:hypothetical protein